MNTKLTWVRSLLISTLLFLPYGLVMADDQKKTFSQEELFTLHYFFLGGKLKEFFHLDITALLWFLSVFSLLFILLGWSHLGAVESGVTHVYSSVTTVISTLTTTGHPLPFAGFTGLEKFLLVILLLVGAGAGSTAGGIKILRIAILYKAVAWLIRRLSLPESVILPLKVRGEIFKEKELREISLFFFIYLLLIFSSCVVLLFYGQDLTDALLLSASAQATASVSPTEISALPVLARTVLIFQMIAGRLEIFPILALLGYLLGGARRKSQGAKGEELRHRILVLRKLRGFN